MSNSKPIEEQVKRDLEDYCRREALRRPADRPPPELYLTLEETVAWWTNRDMRYYARHYREEFRLRVLPLYDKIAIAPWGRIRDQRFQTAEHIDGMFRFTQRRHANGVGFLPGKPSGHVCVFDFDTKEFYREWANRVPVIAASLPTVATHRGFHIYYHNRDELYLNIKGYGELIGNPNHVVVLPPSRHPKDPDFRYQWVGEHPPTSATDIPWLEHSVILGNLTSLTSEQLDKARRDLTRGGYSGPLGVNSPTTQALVDRPVHAPPRPIKPSPIVTPCPTGGRATYPVDAKTARRMNRLSTRVVVHGGGERNHDLTVLIRIWANRSDIGCLDASQIKEPIADWYAANEAHMSDHATLKETQRSAAYLWESREPSGSQTFLEFIAAQVGHIGDPHERILAACALLRRYNAGELFFMSFQVAGFLIGKSADTGGRVLRDLVSQGKLILISKGHYNPKDPIASTYALGSPPEEREPEERELRCAAGTSGRESGRPSSSPDSPERISLPRLAASKTPSFGPLTG